jgi:hypothetical protein
VLPEFLAVAVIAVIVKSSRNTESLLVMPLEKLLALRTGLGILLRERGNVLARKKPSGG